MGTFRAIRIDKAEKGTTAALTQFDEAELMEGDVTVRVEWSTLNYKDGLAVTGKAPVVRRFPMIARHRFRRHRRAIVASAMEGRRQGDLQRLGHGRDPSRRLCRKGPRQGRLAGAAARGHVGARCDGDRHRRLYRDAVGAGAGKARPDARRTVRSSSPVRPAASARSRSRCCRSSAITSSLRPAGCRRPTISRISARPRSSTATNCPGRPSRWPRSAGPAGSTASARPRWPTCCR